MAKGTNQQKPSKKTPGADSDDNDDSSYATAQSKKSEEANDQDAGEADEKFSDTEDDAALSARKTSFYEELDRRIDALSKVQKNSQVLSDQLFTEIYNFMLSIQDASNEELLHLMKSVPNKVGYKWIKKYDIHIVDTNHILIFKQTDGEALDACHRVVKYGSIFDVLREIHELEMGNDHPKAKTLYKRVFMKYGKSIPRWVCEMFPSFCPVCIRANP
jgi:flagellar hook-basal body complex protein FliE